jgi:hypothetical protein
LRRGFSLVRGGSVTNSVVLRVVATEDRAMPDQPTVTYDTDGPFAIVTIDRPAVRNAVDPPQRACRWVPALRQRAVAADRDPNRR